MTQEAVSTVIDEATPLAPDDLELAAEPLNDLGNARRLLARFSDELLYVDRMGWHHWDGRRWQREAGEEEALARAHRTGEAIREEAKALQAEGPKKPTNEKSIAAFEERVARLFKYAVSSGNSAKAQGMLTAAKPYLFAKTARMDAKHFCFNAANGTLELSADGSAPKRRAPRPGDYMTRCAEVAYDPAADCQRFLAFLSEILPDEEMRIFLQTFFGYALSGSTDEQVILICHGTGANGKSTLLDLIREIAGDYAITLPISSFLHNDRRGGGDASPDLARLPGSRMVFASEPDVGSRFSESTLKTITAGEMMTARHLHQDMFEFKPSFKLILSANNRPQIRGQDHGIWRRIRLMPFEQTFDGKVRPMDKRLPAALREEKPGILRWLVDGFSLWCERGLLVPKKIEEATADYRAESDAIGEFVTTCCYRQKGEHITAKRLYAAYEKWCRINAVDVKSKTLFGRRLADLGYHKEKIGTIFYTDVTLTKDALDELEGTEGLEGSDHD